MKSSSTLDFETKRRSLIEYMKVKMDEGDWHAVSDAANDLRVLEATMQATSAAIMIHDECVPIGSMPPANWWPK